MHRLRRHDSSLWFEHACSCWLDQERQLLDLQSNEGTLDPFTAT